MRKIILLTIILLIVPIAAFGILSTTQVQITDNMALDKVSQCETIHWEETIDDFGTCTKNVNAKVCEDDPINKTCHTETQTKEYRCYKGKKTAVKSKEICKDTKMIVTTDKQRTLEYGDWGKCTHSSMGETLLIICDSKYDGNNDGICQSGESCVQFIVTKDSTQTLVRNSQDYFAESDESFFLEKLNLEVI